MTLKITLGILAAALAASGLASTAAASRHVDYKVRVAREARQLRAAKRTIRLQRATIAVRDATIAAREATISTLEDQVAGDASTIAAEKAAIQSHNNQIVSLNQTVRLLTAQRDAAREQAATLQLELNVEPDSLNFAETQIQYEVAWAEGSSTMPHGELVALSAMNYVVGHVSSGAYGYRETHDLPLPTGDSQSVLAYQAGICGHAALTFARIVKDLGLPARSVQFYYSTPAGAPDSHIAVEVSYGGAWHFFDPTFGAYWQDAGGNVTSITDARAGIGTEHRDTVSFTNLVEDPWYQGDDTAFETDPATVVTLDQQPFVS